MLKITDVARKTGRTTKMLQAVLQKAKNAAPGSPIVVFVATADYARCLAGLLAKMAEDAGDREVRCTVNAVALRAGLVQVYFKPIWRRMPEASEGTPAYADHHASAVALGDLAAMVSKVHTEQHERSGAVLRVLMAAIYDIHAITAATHPLPGAPA